MKAYWTFLYIFYTFSIPFSWMKIYESRLKFHRTLFPRVQLAISQHWFKLWFGVEQATSHYLNQCWPSSLTHICGTRGDALMVKTAPNIVIRSDTLTLRWRHNELDGVSDHQPHDCLLNRLFGRRSKKTSKLRVTGHCAGNSPEPVNSPHKGQ